MENGALRILLTGGNGQVGRALRQLLPAENVVVADRSTLDLANPDNIRSTVRDCRPTLIINAAAYTAVDRAETEAGLAMAINGIAPGVLAEEAKRLGAVLVHYSTDYVFDGISSKPYLEEDAPAPINAYGRSKLAGERAILDTGCKHLILRASWIYSALGTNFVLAMLKLARERKEILVVDDQISSPSWAHALACATAELIGKITPETVASGIYHLSSPDYVSRYDFAKKIIAIAKSISGESAGWAEIRPTTTENFPLPALRPLKTATSKEKIKRVFGIEMPFWESQLTNFMKAYADNQRP